MGVSRKINDRLLPNLNFCVISFSLSKVAKMTDEEVQKVNQVRAVLKHTADGLTDGQVFNLCTLMENLSKQMLDLWEARKFGKVISRLANG